MHAYRERNAASHRLYYATSVYQCGRSEYEGGLPAEGVESNYVTPSARLKPTARDEEPARLVFETNHDSAAQLDATAAVD